MNNDPISFSEALIANSAAMDKYLSLSKSRQEEILNGTQNIKTSDEMRSYVERITNL